ncbi:MAG: GNAT family N-acetyltransferase [Pelagibacterium sp. SCN 64-44]|nr:MAG: GNAT family N-acetyltransferase [Pelagibacterium sp. SCN 64-44]
MKTIETDRLVLRNFRAGDAEAMFEYLRDPAASCFLSLKLADRQEAEEAARRRAADDEYIAVCLKDTDQLVGDLFAVAEGDDDADTFSVGWNFNPRFGGKGYAFEAASALLSRLFTAGGGRRIYAYVEDHNAASQRLCSKLGMREEGRFIEFVSFRKDEAGNPVYENTLQYAILRREWEAAVSASQL